MVPRFRSSWSPRILLVALLAGAPLFGCGDGGSEQTSSTSVSSTAASSSATGSGGSGGTRGAGGASPSGGGGAGGGGDCAGVVLCQGRIYQCGDGVDNDGDGLVDAADPDCLGPCHNAESNLDIYIVGQNGSPCYQDCYFDPDVGTGNDDCHWNHRCDPHEVAPDYSPEPSVCTYDPSLTVPGTLLTCSELHDAQSAACHDYCGPLTPNGCDCFGCCELPAGSQNYVWLGSKDQNGLGTCTLDTGLDPTQCHPCAPVPGCMNPCETCELCLGKPAVPAGCDATSQCAPGVMPCGLPGQGCCPQGFYCVTGCCQPPPI